MSPFQEPLEKGWLSTALRSARAEADSWQCRHGNSDFHPDAKSEKQTAPPSAKPKD